MREREKEREGWSGWTAGGEGRKRVNKKLVEWTLNYALVQYSGIPSEYYTTHGSGQ